MNPQVTMLYDWLTISSKKHRYWEWPHLLGLPISGWEEGTGRNGFRNGMRLDGIQVWWEGSPKMNLQDFTCMNMSGQGCRYFEDNGNGFFEALFLMVRDYPKDVRITRLDLALDEEVGLLDMRQMCDYIRSGSYISKANYWEIIESAKGCTVQIGSEQSDVLIRIYDKAKERGFGDDRHWIRCELQLRNAAALGAALKITGVDQTPGSVACGILRNYLRFMDGSDVAQWWEDFLGITEKIRIVQKVGTEYNLAALESYVIGQAGQSISTYIQCAGIDKFIEQINEKGTQLNPKQRSLVSKYM